MPSNLSGWFAVARADIAQILDHAGAKNGPSLVCVWVALLNISNACRSTSITIPVSTVARAAGITYRPTLKALHALEEIGLVSITTRMAERSAYTNEPSEYTLHATVSPCVQTTGGVGQNDRGGRSSKFTLMTDNKRTSKQDSSLPTGFVRRAD